MSPATAPRVRLPQPGFLVLVLLVHKLTLSPPLILDPEDIVFGPPRMAFASSGRGGGKTVDGEKAPKEGDAQSRFANLRTRNGESDGDRFRESRNANPLRRRGDTDDSDGGWTPVKPRKSFGAEGAERFREKFAGTLRDDKKTPRMIGERSARPFDSLTRDKERERDGEEGANKNGTDSWHKSKTSETRVPEKRERIDRAKSWRERDPEAEQQDERDSRLPDRRWVGRAEREPEWLDEPQEVRPEARTQQDFQKWMEAMKQAKSGGGGASKPTAVPIPDPSPEASKPPVQSAPAAEIGPDKFFMAFGSTTSTDVKTPGEQPDAPNRAKAAGKSSRFTSFFSQPQPDKVEPPPSAPVLPSYIPEPAPSIFSGGFPGASPSAPPDDEKQAFQLLLSKLQKQSMSATPPGASAFPTPGHGHPGDAGKNHVSASPLQALLGGNQRDGPIGRPAPHHEILAPRPQPQAARPEQLLQDLVGHHQRVSSQGSGRGDGTVPRNNNSNTEFLMNLMRGPGGPDRADSAMLRAFQQAPPPNQGPPPPPSDEYQRENRNAQRQVRPGPPPGFPMDDGSDFMQNPNQPTQILQRPPPPPGLEQMPPSWMAGRGQMPPPPTQQGPPPPQQGQGQGPQGQHPQQRGPMLPPPGLAGRNPPPPGMPPMFPPNFPPGAMPPHPDMGPPRNMGPPPPGFFGQMPPGFMLPGMRGFGGPPPQVESPGGFGPTSPFEARGMMPPGGPGANFGRG